MRPAPPRWARRAADGLLGLVAASISLSTTGMQAGVLGLAALSLLAAVRGWDVVRSTPLDAAIGLFFGILALSTLASGHVLEATGWQRPWVVVAYFAVFWWLRDRAHAARFARLTVGAAALAGAYGILQHYTGADWYRRLLGRATEVRRRDPGSSGFAVVGFFKNYLTFAHTMLFPLAWAAALGVRGSALGLCATPLVVAAIVFSTARGVWLALVALAAGCVLLARGRAAASLLGAATLAAGLGFVLAPELGSHALGMFGTGGVNRGRFAIYRANLDIVHEHPMLGLGFGRYRTAALPYYAAHPDADRRSHAHSNYLQIAAESGLLGLAAFALLFATALRIGWPAVARAPDAGAWAAAAGAWLGLVAFLVAGATQYSFGDNEVALTMWVALAVLARCREG